MSGGSAPLSDAVLEAVEAEIPRDSSGSIDELPSKSRNLAGIPLGIPPPNRPILKNPEESSRTDFRLGLFLILNPTPTLAPFYHGPVHNEAHTHVDICACARARRSCTRAHVRTEFFCIFLNLGDSSQESRSNPDLGGKNLAVISGGISAPFAVWRNLA